MSIKIAYQYFTHYSTIILYMMRSDNVDCNETQIEVSNFSLLTQYVPT